MRINKVLDYYYRAYKKAAAGKEAARPAINAFKGVVQAANHPDRYRELKKHVLRLCCGPLYWPNTFPTAVDQATVELLYSLVRLSQPEIVVDIGTAKGNSAIAIGQALADNGMGKVYTIDPEEQELVRIAIRKSHLQKQIKYCIGYSTKVVPQLSLPRVDFAFIDGDHAYAHVRADYDLVKHKIPSGGLLVFHDTNLFEGPKRVVEELKKEGLFECVSLPTLSGGDGKGGAQVKSQKKPDFIPVGITVCRKQ